LHPKANGCRLWALLSLFVCWASAPLHAAAENGTRFSKTISSVLREPLPAEELALTESAAGWVISGPTFTYQVQRTTGAIVALRVVRDGEAVIVAKGPADIQVDQYRLTSELNTCKLAVISRERSQIVLQADGTLWDPTKRGPAVNYTLLHTFFNDGVVVSKVTLTPQEDLRVETAIVCRLGVAGQLSHYLHKRRDEHGDGAARGTLPEPGKAVRVSTLTSCLQVFSPTAALALFTDSGALHLGQAGLDTAVVEVMHRKGNRIEVSLAQYLVHIAPGDKHFVLRAGEPFQFRVGISVAPNRQSHPRMHDLRMFTWIGDAQYPYPTDEEIAEVAQLGFTLFQMHRVGTPGEPRAPAGELQRVIRKVHESGMLFLWEENADLLFATAPGVQELKANGKWSLWQGFNYNGRYQASMDPVCDLVATCLAAPNGLAEYRLANIGRMLDRFPVDGIYLDNNLAYPNCKLWREHGHPREVYDCLIELHEMNWRRRQLLRSRCPHTVLVSHNSRGIILPVVCDFDVSLYGEGYSFDSVENYWNYYRAVNNLPAQGMIWPGGDEPNRCAAALAYNFDLLTGGGQYSQTDWRLYPKKFPYARGVGDLERLYVRTYNLAQYYFGLYESTPHYFASPSNLFRTTTGLTYATVYRNRVWGDWLIPIINMHSEALSTSLQIHSPQVLGILPETDYVLFDIHQRVTRALRGKDLGQVFSGISVPGQNLRLLYLRQLPAKSPYHLWGGKRISELWDGRAQKLTLAVHGPAGLQDTLFVGGAEHGIQEVVVAGKRVAFFFDRTQGLAHGTVTFAAEPLKMEVRCSPDGASGLPERQVAADALAFRLKSSGG